MNQPILQQYPLGQNYSLPPDQDCIDHLGSHAHHTPYANGGVPEHLRRENELGVGQANLQSLNSNRPASLVNRPAHDPPFHAGLGISEPGSGSISTSPSSNASSVAYSPFPQSTQYPQSNLPHSLASPYPTASQVFPTYLPQYNGSVPSGRQKVSSMLTDLSGFQQPARSSIGLHNPVSPHSSTTIRDNYTTSTPGLNRHMISPRSQIDHLARPSYNSVPEAPRSMASSTNMSLSAAVPYGSGSGMGYQGTGMGYQGSQEARNPDEPPFLQQEDFHEIYCDGALVKPIIDSKTEKGFFFSTDQCYTCYRRNYFSVQCSYTINPHCSNKIMYLSRTGGKGQEQIQAMAMCLSAAVDGSAGKNIELVQHTPKRDKGPQTAIQITKLLPLQPGGKHPHLHSSDPHSYPHGLPPFGQSSATSDLAGPYLPLQGVQEASSSQNQGEQPVSPAAQQHTFERIQFKSATANNGKRRAQQQYYHLIIELLVDVRLSHQQAPNWVKIAQRASAPVVVRGRSPSHYSNEGPHSTGSRGSGGAPGGSGLGQMGVGSAFGPTGFSTRSLGTGFSYPSLGGTYRGGNQYSHEPSPMGSKSESSASSTSGGPVDTLEHGKPVTLTSNSEDDDGVSVETSFNDYQYYPSPSYDAGLPPLVKSHVQGYEIGRVKGEFNPHGPGSLSTGGIGRFHGTDSSRGFYTADAVY